MAKKFSGFSTSIVPDKTSTSQFIVGYSGQDNAQWTMKALADEIGGGGDNIYTADGTIASTNRTITTTGTSNIIWNLSGNSRFYINSLYVLPTGRIFTPSGGGFTINSFGTSLVGGNLALYSGTHLTGSNSSGYLTVSGTANTADISARLGVVGKGNTNATYGLRVQNVDEIDTFSVDDTGLVSVTGDTANSRLGLRFIPSSSAGGTGQYCKIQDTNGNDWIQKYQGNVSSNRSNILFVGKANGYASENNIVINGPGNVGAPSDNQTNIGDSSLWVWQGGNIYGQYITGKTQDSTSTALLVRNWNGNAGVPSFDTYFQLRNDKRLIYNDGNEAVGKVLTCDANGVATWQTAGGGDNIYTADGTITSPTHRKITLAGTSAQPNKASLEVSGAVRQGDFKVGNGYINNKWAWSWSMPANGFVAERHFYQANFYCNSTHETGSAASAGTSYLSISSQGLEHHKVSVGVGINGTVNDRLVVKGASQVTSQYTARFLDGADNDILTLRNDRRVELTSAEGLRMLSGSLGYGVTTLTPYGPTNTAGFKINNGLVQFTVGNNGCAVNANNAANAKLRVAASGAPGVNAPHLHVITNTNDTTEAVVIENSDGTDLLNIKENGRTSFSSQVSVGLKSSAAIDGINWDDGNIQEVTLASGENDFDPTNEVPGSTYILKITQPSSADGTIAWENTTATVNWPGGTAPTLTATNAAVDIVTLVCTAANTYYGTSALNFS